MSCLKHSHYDVTNARSTRNNSLKLKTFSNFFLKFVIESIILLDTTRDEYLLYKCNNTTTLIYRINFNFKNMLDNCHDCVLLKENSPLDGAVATYKISDFSIGH